MQFAQNVFPEAASVDENGNVSIDGVSVAAIAEEFSTPVMVYSARDIRDEAKKFVDDFDQVFYSMKAAPIVGVGRIISAVGAGCTVAGEGELEVALRAGFDPEKIVMHGNNKSTEDITSGLKSGIGRFVVEDAHECDHIERIAGELGINEVDVQVRITPGIEAHTHEYLMTGAIDSKFGNSIEYGIATKACERVLDSDVLVLRGLHCHIGTQIFDTEPLAQAGRVIAEFLVTLMEQYSARSIESSVTEINVGGGFGIHYQPDDDPPPTIDMANAVRSAVDEVCALNNLGKIEVWCEPGRAIVGRAGVTIYTVGSIKEIPDMRTYVAVDGGMSDNLRPAIYGARHLPFVNGKTGEDKIVTIAGKHCEEGDKLAIDVPVASDVEIGDLLVMASTGAYAYAMSSNYNMLPHISVVLVDDGKASEIVRRETIDEMLSHMV